MSTVFSSVYTLYVDATIKELPIAIETICTAKLCFELYMD